MSKLMINNASYNYEANVYDLEQPVYVFLHGFLGSKHDFDRVISDFPGQYLALDLLGLGANRYQNIPEKRFEQSNQVEDLKSIFDELSLRKINLVGYSMGGRIAIAYALKYPQKINQLILESTTAGISDDEMRKKRQEHDRGLAENVIKDGMIPFVDKWENMPLFDSQKDVTSESFQFMHSQRIHQNAQNVANSLLMMGTGTQPNYWPEIQKLNNLNVLILTGSLDKKFTDIGEKLHHSIDNSKFIQVENAGHNIHFEYPNEFTQII